MLQVLSQREAEAGQIQASLVQCISPYRNPAHVLSPPRRWLEALADGEWGWSFFRLRYRNLLRDRYAADPQRFQRLVDASDTEHELYLTCHCESERCHRVLARDFIELVRAKQQREAAARHVRQARRHVPRSNPGWSRRAQTNLLLSTLIEQPVSEGGTAA